MTFSNFIKLMMSNHVISNFKELYETLGGEKALGVKLRQFQLICSDKSPPTGDVFARIFSFCNDIEKKDSILAYFKTLLMDTKEQDDILKFISSHLQPGTSNFGANAWKKNSKIRVLDIDQLDILSRENNYRKFYAKLLLQGSIKKTECGLTTNELSELQTLDLIRIKNDLVLPSSDIAFFPNKANSTPLNVEKGTEIMLKYLSSFLDKKGNKYQEISFRIQYIKKGTELSVLEQSQAFTKWLDSIAIDKEKTSSEVIPFFSFTVGKILNESDL